MMSLFPRFISHDSVTSELAPVWRLLDNYANQIASARNEAVQGPSPPSRSFNPRFDVKEVESAYELKGELPGVEQSNIEIEFPDQRTIVIKGSTGHNQASARSSPQQSEEQPEEITPPEKSSNRATVEDEPEYVDAAYDAATETASTEASAEATPVSTPATQQVQQPAETPAQTSRYWISERYTGQFQRVFTFPAPVDTENTTAKLRNGVLEVVIPKIQKAGIKRISIE